jgi:hypothetical protein
MPPHWFAPPAQPILRQLIVHVINAEILTAWVREDWVANNRYSDKLHQQLMREGKMVLYLSSKLRLTPASRTAQTDAHSAQRNLVRARPWEDNEDIIARHKDACGKN